MEQFENEIWKPVDVNPVYLVSNYGRVRTIDHPVWCKVNNSYSIRKGRFCVPSNNNSKKYYRVAIQINNKRKMFSVHRLVATAFIPNPNNLPQINHIDGDKNNNRVSNLEWCDNLYNMRHAIANGLNQTEKHKKRASVECNFRKLTMEQVHFIKEEYKKLNTSIYGVQAQFCKEIAEQFKLNSTNTILWIITDGTNRYSDQDIVQTTNYDDMLKEREIIHTNYESSKRKTYTEYAIELGVPPKTFHSRLRALNYDLEATINFYKQKYHIDDENRSGKENTSS